MDSLILPPPPATQRHPHTHTSHIHLKHTQTATWPLLIWNPSSWTTMPQYGYLNTDGIMHSKYNINNSNMSNYNNGCISLLRPRLTRSLLLSSKGGPLCQAGTGTARGMPGRAFTKSSKYRPGLPFPLIARRRTTFPSSLGMLKVDVSPFQESLPIQVYFVFKTNNGIGTRTPRMVNLSTHCAAVRS